MVCINVYTYIYGIYIPAPDKFVQAYHDCREFTQYSN